MADVVFAKAFRRHVECPDSPVPGSSVREVLEAYFAQFPAVRGYVLDEGGALRKHVAVFVNDDMIGDRRTLTDPVTVRDRVHVFQALSGG